MDADGTVSTSLSLREAISTLGFRTFDKSGKLEKDWLDDEGHIRTDLFLWPPDVFAMAATVLRESGAYLQCVRPQIYSKLPKSRITFEYPDWTKECDRIAREWREDACANSLPIEVKALLEEIAVLALQKSDIAAPRPFLLQELSRPVDGNFSWLPFVQLLCIADAASRGMGVAFDLRIGAKADSSTDKAPSVTSESVAPTKRESHASICLFVNEAMKMIQDHVLNLSTATGGVSSQPDNRGFHGMTLCRYVDRARALVMPKMRTSQRGVTIRSLSLHLSLMNGTDVEPIWIPNSSALLPNGIRPNHIPIDANITGDMASQCGPYNIILLPWPHEMSAQQFVPMTPRLDCLGKRPPEHDQFFKFVHRDLDKLSTASIRKLIYRATRAVGPIHGLVLPEMAVSLQQYNELFPKTTDYNVEFIACGVYEPPINDLSLGKNYAIVRRRTTSAFSQVPLITDFCQHKHHRWALDPGQVAQYSLGSSLSPNRTWWEGVDLPRRSLHFYALDAFTAFTVLICEDLSRPDPVADAVRAVGPNLAICLLQDGPQLATRWSSRCATVFADDPGSSVLTLTSLGMAKRCRLKERLHEYSRTVALWREPGGAPIEIQLPEDADALVLTMTAHPNKEFTIDGRDDSSVAVTLRLAGVHPLSWKN